MKLEVKPLHAVLALQKPAEALLRSKLLPGVLVVIKQAITLRYVLLWSETCTRSLEF